MSNTWQYLIVDDNSLNAWICNKFIEAHIEYVNINRYNNFISRRIKKIISHFNNVILGDYIHNNIDKYNNNKSVIILLDTIYAKFDLQWLRMHFPNFRIILWFWNPVGSTISLQDITAKDIELWSYSITDSENYNLHYNTPFYPLHNVVNCDDVNEYDIIFWGRDKKRRGIIEYYNKIFKKIGLDTRIHITPDRWFQSLYKRKMSHYVTYDKIIADIKRSRSILDIYTNPMAGLSLRTMEALFYKKKLITNSMEIKRYDFYSKENVFVLGEDDIQYLADFVKSPYIDVDPQIVCKYSVTSWLERFDIKS